MKTILYAICAVVVLAAALSPASSYAFACGDGALGRAGHARRQDREDRGYRGLYEYDQPYEKVLAWYKEALKNYKDQQMNIDFAKYRDWKDQMYIEDQGAANWHSIGISKAGGTKQR